MATQSTIENVINGKKKNNYYNKKWYFIDKLMLTSKFTTFLLFTKLALYEPNIIVYFLNIGLTPTEARAIGGLRWIGAILGAHFGVFLLTIKNNID